jgi:hypothetical protein
VEPREDLDWLDDEHGRRRRAQALIDVLNEVEMDFTGSADAWRYGGGRDLSRLAEKAREASEDV